MYVAIPAFGKQLQAESPGLMGGSGGALALLGGPHTIDVPRRYVASNDKSESTRQAAKKSTFVWLYMIQASQARPWEASWSLRVIMKACWKLS